LPLAAAHDVNSMARKYVLTRRSFQADSEQLLRLDRDSIGSCFSTSRAKPLTMRATASSDEARDMA